MATKAENERLAVLETKMTIVEENLKAVDQKVDKLPDELIKRIDDKFANREATNKRLDDLEEVTGPLKEIKQKLWQWFIGLVFGIAALEAIAYLLITQVLKKG